MIDALGRPQRVLVLGGSSDIALAAVQLWAQQVPGLQVVLAGRPGPRRDRALEKVRGWGAVPEVLDFDALDTQEHPALLRRAVAGGDVDVAVVAFGVLGDEEQAWQDHTAAVELARVNYVGAVSVGVLLGEVMKQQGHGSIVALSSVAGERVRRSNFVYGSSKAGMDGFYLGLGEALAGSGVHVSVVRPGFVASTMTQGRDPAPLSVTPEQAGQAIVDAVRERKDLVWVPAPMRAVMSVLRHVPRPVFRRLPL